MTLYVVAEITEFVTYHRVEAATPQEAIAAYQSGPAGDGHWGELVRRSVMHPHEDDGVVDEVVATWDINDAKLGWVLVDADGNEIGRYVESEEEATP